MGNSQKMPIRVGDIVRRTYLYDNHKEKLGLVVAPHRGYEDDIIFWLILWDTGEKLGLVSEYEVEVVTGEYPFVYSHL